MKLVKLVSILLLVHHNALTVALATSPINRFQHAFAVQEVLLRQELRARHVRRVQRDKAQTRVTPLVRIVQLAPLQQIRLRLACLVLQESIQRLILVSYAQIAHQAGILAGLQGSVPSAMQGHILG